MPKGKRDEAKTKKKLIEELEVLRQKNQELEKYEQKWSAIMAGPYSITIARIKDQIFIEVNRGFEQNTGYCREEVIGKTPDEIGLLKNPQDLKRMFEIIQRDGFIKDHLTKLTTKTGEEIISLISSKLVMLGGEPHLVSIGKNITEQKQAETNLLESEERYRLLVNNIPSVVWATSQEGQTMYISPNVEQVYGYTSAEILAGAKKFWLDRIHPQDIEEVKDNFNRLFVKDEPYDVEYRIKRKDGEWIWLHDRANAKEIKGDIRYAYGVFSDITLSKEAELALVNSEERFRRMFEEGPIGMAVIDFEKNFVRSNQVLCLMLGFIEAELLNITPGDIAYPGDFKPDEELASLFSGEMTRFQKEMRLFKKDKKIIWVHLTASVLHLAEEDFKYVLCVVEDITEKKEVAEKEKKYLQQLMQADKMASLGTLVAGVAHEINNPNNAILFNSLLLRDIFKDVYPLLKERSQEMSDFELGGLPFKKVKESTTELFSGITRSSERIQAIVTELKNFSRPDLSDLNQEVNINDVVREAGTLVHAMIKKSTSKFDLILGENFPTIRGNHQRLEQVIINLLQNACQSLETKSQGIKLSTFFNPTLESITIIVADEGCGIAADKIPFLTDPFYTTRRDQGGTGLGLSVSTRIVKDHGGHLQIKSTAGKGSIFTVILPINREEGETNGE